MQDHVEALRVARERGDRVVVGRARVDDERLAELAREADVRGERALLVGARRVVAVVVEAGLADRGAARVAGELAQLVRDRVGVARRVVGVVADGEPHLGVRLGGGLRAAAALRVGADREDPRDAGLRRGGDDLGVGAGRRVEVGVAVDHGAVGVAGRAALLLRLGEQRRDARHRRPARAGAERRVLERAVGLRRARRAASPWSRACTGAAAA